MRSASSKVPSSRAKTPAKPPGTHSRTGGEVRLIGGYWKRVRLKVADKPGLRPTPDRVRETLFNWLGQDLTGWCCVDVFAGSGALGLEAASRGAREVLLVEQDGVVATQLQQGLAHLQTLQMPPGVTLGSVRVQRGDGVAQLRQLAPDSQDLVFLDPPFGASLFDAALAAAARVLTLRGCVYLEAPVAWTDVALAPYSLQVVRHLKAGAVHAHLLRRLPGSPA